MRYYDVCVIGDLVVDYIIRIPQLPVNPGECIRAKKAYKTPGGSANFLITASRLGLQVTVLDVVGDDEEGEIILNTLKREGVHTEGIKLIKNTKTTHVLILIDDTGNHAFVGILGVRLDLSVVDEEIISKSKYLYVSCYSMLSPKEIKATVKAVEIAHKNGVRVFFDPGPLCDKVPTHILMDIISQSYIVSPNDNEAERIANTHNLKDAARKLLNMGAKIVIIKMGSRGALLAYDNILKELPTIDVRVVDTTGAGDSFNAGLLYGLIKGLTLEEAVTLANVMGAIKVQKLGTGENMPTLRELVHVLKEIKFEKILNKLKLTKFE